MKKKALVLVTAAIMTAITLLAGCAGKKNDDKNAGKKREQKLVLREGALKTMDSVLATDQVSFDVIQNLRSSSCF